LRQSVTLSADGSTAMIGGPFDEIGSAGAVWTFANQRHAHG
jgi:hypothetical protein